MINQEKGNIVLLECWEYVLKLMFIKGNVWKISRSLLKRDMGVFLNS